MSLYQQFASSTGTGSTGTGSSSSFADLNPPTTFDSPLTLSALSPFSTGTSDSLAGIDLTSLAATFGSPFTGTSINTNPSAINSSTSSFSSLGENFNNPFSLNPNSVERILHLPQAYSPVTPPEKPFQQPAQAITNGKVNSITTSVIVANSSITSSTTATISKSNDLISRSSKASSGLHRPVTSSTVSTIVMQPAGKSSSNGNSSSSSNGSHSQQCLVCGDLPLGKNFGVVTCGSCKIFFRRNIIFADKTKSQCRNNNRCSITKTNRRNCAACRLRKCIDLGMKVKQNKQPKTKSSDNSLDEAGLDLGSQDGMAAAAEGTENFANHRVHSQQSSATSEEEGDEGYYRDLPSLISVEEVKTRLQDRCRRNSDQPPPPASHQSTTDSLLDEVNSVIIEHIKEEEEVVKKQGSSSVINGNSSRNHQLVQIASAIENLSAAAAAAGQIYTSVGGSNTLLESIEQLSQQQQQRHSPSNRTTTTTASSIVSSVIIPNHTALGLGLRNGSEPTACFSPASVITHHQSSSSAFADQSSTTPILQATSLPDVEEINVEEEEEMEEEKEMLEEEEDVVANENNEEEEDEKMEEAEEEEETDVEELQPTEVSHNSTNGLSTTTTEAQSHHYYESSTLKSSSSITVNLQQQHSQSCNSSNCGIDLALPECIAKSKHERLLYFYQQQQAPYLSCGFTNFQQQEEKVVVDGFNRSNFASDDDHRKYTDGQALHLLQRRRRKRMLEEEYPAIEASDTMELVKVEAKNLSSPNHSTISELMKMTSLIRIKLGIEYSSELFQLTTKELREIANLNTACRMIEALKPNTATNHCTHVSESLRHGIFYANQTFKVFEEFWLQNTEMRELIRQDETGFDRKRNNLLHMLYHCRGVYNFDESQNAWAVSNVSNGNNPNTFAYIKLTMFNESIKKEMSDKHYQYIQSFPKEWRQDSTVFNLMTFLLIFGAFKEMHSQSKYEKIRFQTLLYLVRRHFEDKYRDTASALQMLNHMLQLIEDLEPLSSDCLTACTHSLNPRILERIGPNYAACLMLEMKQKKEDEEHRLRRRKHSRHSESSSCDGGGGGGVGVGEDEAVSREQQELERLEKLEQQQQLEQYSHYLANGEFP